MTNISKILCLTVLLGFSSLPALAGTTTNLKTKTGSVVGGLDSKHSNQTYAAIQRQAALPDNNFQWPQDWAWENGINPDKPLFNQLDKNQNGFISKLEFKNSVINDKELEAFAFLDKNNDRQVNRSEFEVYTKALN